MKLRRILFFIFKLKIIFYVVVEKRQWKYEGKIFAMPNINIGDIHPLCVCVCVCVCVCITDVNSIKDLVKKMNRCFTRKHN
jgi:hypothetical protein